MLRSKAFVKRTRKGNVVKVVKEHYLRDDITCSSAACNACEQQSLPILSANPRKSELTDRPHYIIPDTNVFMNQVWIYRFRLAIGWYTQSYFTARYYGTPFNQRRYRFADCP